MYFYGFDLDLQIVILINNLDLIPEYLINNPVTIFLLNTHSILEEIY